jgi:hypothetical protein
VWSDPIRDCTFKKFLPVYFVLLHKKVNVRDNNFNVVWSTPLPVMDHKALRNNCFTHTLSLMKQNFLVLFPIYFTYYRVSCAIICVRIFHSSQNFLTNNGFYVVFFIKYESDSMFSEFSIFNSLLSLHDQCLSINPHQLHEILITYSTMYLFQPWLGHSKDCHNFNDYRGDSEW